MLYLIVLELLYDGVNVFTDALIYHQKRICNVDAVLSAAPLLVAQVFQKQVYNIVLDLKFFLKAKYQGKHCI